MNPRLQIPHKTKYEAAFLSGPYPTGVGACIANALRRVLLSSLSGYRIDRIKVEGARHEFSILPGVKEDLSEIIQKLKHLAFQNTSCDGPVFIRLDIKGKDVILASDISCSGEISP